MIELGADLTARNQRGDAAMHLAGKAEMFDIVELLKSKGAQQLPPEEIGPLLDLADPERGKERFLAKCDYCHALRETNSNDVGPSLWNIVGRSQSTQEGFDYSAALRRLEGKWDYESLNLLLLDSRAYFPGSNMRRGNSAIMITEPRDRADIISFLRLQSTEPLPLP